MVLFLFTNPLNVIRDMDADDLIEAKIYVGTYKKYNEGSIEGKWLELSDYIDKDDFYEACADLHSDEDDAEFMFQDWEGIPDGLIGESWLSETVFELIDKANQINDFDAFLSFLDFTGYSLEDEELNYLIEKFKDSFYGRFINEESFASLLIEDGYFGEIVENIKSYLDYGSIANDLFVTDYYYDNETNAVFYRNY